MKKGVAIFLCLAALALGVVCGAYFTERRYRAALEDMKPQIDTLVKRDTIVQWKPVHKTRYICDTLLLPVRDTVRQSDTVFVPVPIERRVYEDSTYRAVVSGFRPSLDSISVYQTTTVVEKIRTEKVQPRWSFGVQAGMGFTIDQGVVRAAPYLGIGGQYNLINFGYDFRRKN